MAHSSSLLHSSSSLSWDLQNLGVFNADLSLVMDGGAPFCSSLMDQSDDFSTGYLEDALLEFSSERSKRRRLLLFSDDTSDDHQINYTSSKDFAMSYWNNNSSCNWGLSENFSCISQIASFNGVSDEPISCTSMSRISNEEANMVPDIKTPEETSSAAIEALDSSSSSYKNSAKSKSIFDEDILPSSGVEDKKKKRVIKRVVYPFALVKPGGKEGDVTLHDINERILMPPTRPVRHPVGDFACRPCVSADGPGLSGKAVVALTKIHTQGRGTITIIRTKG
ncbi:protein XRI1-like [Melia azedarach]|uniref:Protein XRI1-like n=1 Tax=Melia azedarach TaxID=155640 RepID=A0ACC1XG34_MELAZ|nr:protein XRI1-like [Melia azedarach]